MTTIIAEVSTIAIVVYILVMGISFILSPSIAKQLSKRSNYRIITDGDKFDYEKKFIPAFIPFITKWNTHDGKYYFESIDAVEADIDRKVTMYQNDLVADSKTKQIVKTY